MRIKTVFALTVCSLALAACVATPLPDPGAAHLSLEAMKSSFKPRGQAGLDRLNQYEVQAACSKYRNRLPPELAEKTQQAQLATIRYPDKLMGDWRAGERIAQSGIGKQFSDDPKIPAGGNCYACHQLAPQELAYGTIGTSLYQYGKQRGTGVAMQRYTYGKIYNPEAYSACSSMPRFGYHDILTPEQIADLVALLMHPDSPVNK